MRRDVLMLTAAALLLTPAMVARAGCHRARPARSPSCRAWRFSPACPKYLQAESLLVKDQDAYKLEIAKLQGALDSRERKLPGQGDAPVGHRQGGRTEEAAGPVRPSCSSTPRNCEQKFAARRQELVGADRAAGPGHDRRHARRDTAARSYSTPTPRRSGIASVDKSLDLTQRVIDRLKAAGDGPAATPVSKPPTGIKPPAPVARPKKP